MTMDDHTAPSAQQPKPYLTIQDLQQRWSVSRATAYKTVGKEGFPLPLRLGAITRYPLDQVEAWERAEIQGQA